MSFVSDFSLLPTEYIGIPEWKYKKATWSYDIDPEVHKLFDRTNTEPIHYTRTTLHGQLTQTCKISFHGENIIVEPGDGYNFLVRRDDIKNRINNKEIDNINIPHEMLCKICMVNKMNYAVKECYHVSMCSDCATYIYANKKECPICRIKMKEVPIKLFFS